MSDVTERLEAVRKELLYLGLRNPLINYRTLKARGLALANPSPSSLFQQVVRDNRSLRFASADSGPDTQTLHTPYDADVLQKRLETTAISAMPILKNKE